MSVLSSKSCFRSFKKEEGLIYEVIINLFLASQAFYSDIINLNKKKNYFLA